MYTYILYVYSHNFYYLIYERRPQLSTTIAIQVLFRINVQNTLFTLLFSCTPNRFRKTFLFIIHSINAIFNANLIVSFVLYLKILNFGIFGLMYYLRYSSTQCNTTNKIVEKFSYMSLTV